MCNDSGACEGCAMDSQCPPETPRCDTSDDMCKCGAAETCPDGEKANICSGTETDAKCICGKEDVTQNNGQCDTSAILPKCLNDAIPPIFVVGDTSSTCKVYAPCNYFPSEVIVENYYIK